MNQNIHPFSKKDSPPPVQPQLKFLLDEHIAKSIAKQLRILNIDAVTVGEIGRIEIADLAHLHYAYEQGRIMFTIDSDFLELHAQNIPHSGIVFLNPKLHKKLSLGKIIQYLVLLVNTVTPEQMQGRVEYVFDIGDW